jgi:hypothetical protein
MNYKIKQFHSAQPPQKIQEQQQKEVESVKSPPGETLGETTDIQKPEGKEHLFLTTKKL